MRAQVTAAPWNHDRLGALYARDLPASIRRSYGDGARKVPVGPFDVVTLYDEDADVVTVASLVHQRAAW